MQTTRVKKTIKPRSQGTIKKIEIQQQHQVSEKRWLKKPTKSSQCYFSTSVSEACSSTEFLTCVGSRNELDRNVLIGKLEGISPPKQAIVRIYFSSNPTDSNLEKSVLWNEVVPKLQQYCRERHDMECQIVDLNDGPDEGALVSQEKRLREIQLCKQRSAATCFVALVGHKYWCPHVPKEINLQLFEALLKVAYASGFPNARLLELNYERDENATPPVYVLKHGSSILKLQSTFSTSGATLAKKLQNLFHDAALRAFHCKAITDDQANLFLVSNLQAELQEGLQTSSKGEARKCVCYLRTITSMDTDMNFNRVHPYLDIMGVNEEKSSLYVTEDMLDADAQATLHSIRECWIPERVAVADGELQVYKCSVDWVPQVGLKKEIHNTYLDDFCHQLQIVVTETTSKYIKEVYKENSYKEALCHCLIAKHLYHNYCKLPSNTLKLIQDYICGPCVNPLIVHGQSGSGKTFITAAAASEIALWFEKDCEPIMAVRFLGQTCTSSYIPLLLHSLCIQLTASLGRDQEAPGPWCTDVTHQRSKLTSILKEATINQPIIIFLDGLENLLDVDEHINLSSWLPIQLPDYAKIILSIDTNSSVFSFITRNSKDLNLNIKYHPLLSQKEYSKFLRNMLASTNRKMTSGQHVFAIQRAISKGLQKDGIIHTTPCMAHIVYTHAVRWKSSKDVTQSTIGENESDAIRQYMVILQQRHGQYIVQVTARLITAAKYGLTEQEMVEILWTYRAVQTELTGKLRATSKSMATAGQLRSILTFSLSNLLEDMSSILMSKVIAGCQLYCWSNKIVKSVIESLYLKKPEADKTTKTSLIHYYNEYLKNGLYPTNQNVPLKTVHVALAIHQHFLDQNNQSKAMELCYTNLYWLSAVSRSLSIVHTLFFLEKAFEIYNDRSLVVIERAIRLALGLLHQSVNILPGELFSRIMPLLYKFPSLKKLMVQCTENRPDITCLLPAGIHAQSPGAPLKVSLTENKMIRSVLAYETSSSMNITYCSGKHLKMYDMTNGDLLREIVFNEKIEWMKISDDHEFIIILSGKLQNLYFLDESTSHCLNKISLQGYFDSEHKPIPVQDIKAAVGVSLVVVWIKNSTHHLLAIEIKTAALLAVFPIKTLVHECVLSSDEQYIFALNMPKTITVFSITTAHVIAKLEPSEISSSGSIRNFFTNLNGYLITVFSGGFVHVWKPVSNTIFTHAFELDSRSSDHERCFDVIHSSASNNKHSLAVVKATEIDIWNLQEWKTKCIIPHRRNEAFKYAYFTNQEHQLLVILENDFSIYVWNISKEGTVSCSSMLDGHTSCICTAWAPSIQSQDELTWIITLSEDNCIKIWDMKNLPMSNTLTMLGRKILKVHCIGNQTVTMDGSDKLTVWNTVNGDIAYQLKHEANVEHCTATVWKMQIISADALGYQYVWDIQSGESIFKIQGPPVENLLLTFNEHLIISIFKRDHGNDQLNDASRVWRINTAQVICTFNYSLMQPQVTFKNTFLTGISNDGKLYAISLWTGLLAKILWVPDAEIVMLHALTGNDHVLSLDNHNNVIVWNVPEETKLFSVDMKNNEMNNVCVSDTGAILTMLDDQQTIKVLKVRHGKLCTIDTFGIPVLMSITHDGLDIVYISMQTSNNNIGSSEKRQYHLVVIRTTSDRSMSTYPLEGTPTCMHVAKTDQAVAIGLDEGRVVVFTMVKPDTKSSIQLKNAPKAITRKLLCSKKKVDQVWHSNEPKYDLLYPIPPSQEMHAFLGRSHDQNPRNKSLPQISSSSGHHVSVHIPRSKTNQQPTNKSVNMSRISNSSKVKVFM
ncbi:unnamed protein product [Clavelina lepadiformis]|uniref:NWD1/2-like winged helix-turn-helix domain-containing protein n=1 Tax=Clavelina lepadiformis TaxID=159417 RepID=A0ABP0FAM7_CLALP